MSSISSFVPIKSLPKREEVSSLRSPVDSAAIYSEWRAINDIVKNQNQLLQLLNQMNRELEKLKNRKKTDWGLYPFAIYQVPDSFRGADSGSYTLNNNWTTVRIRNGQVLNNLVNYTGSQVYGTDGYPYPDVDTMPVGNGWQSPVDVVVPNGSNQYWFWVEAFTGSYSYSGSNYAVQYGSGSSILTTGIQSGWSNWPSASANHIPIGFVDNVSSSSLNQIYVRQFLRTDVMSNAVSYVTMSACINGTPVTLALAGYIVSGSV